ncbi:hypothetical protein C2G38_2287817 [Gigaspora rosea]|uniref:Uncharacterized protein n=1 Tax=Gigaspora rosea TaxID=44941 RepID=A0A397WBB6_9GLOM|nr:hypothetical protein C2G38_2287817 [Gigaspora rosea]
MNNQKINEEINNLAILEEIVEDKALDKDNREILIEAEDGSNEKKNSDQLTKPFDGKALNHACERWLKQVKDFRITCEWDEKSKIKESLTTESTKEIANFDNCNRAKIRVKKDKNGYEAFEQHLKHTKAFEIISLQNWKKLSIPKRSFKSHQKLEKLNKIDI